MFFVKVLSFSDHIYWLCSFTVIIVAAVVLSLVGWCFFFVLVLVVGVGLSLFVWVGGSVFFYLCVMDFFLLFDFA